MKYRICKFEAVTPDQLDYMEGEINIMLDMGWEPLGPPQAFYEKDYTFLFQTMIKKDELFW